MKRYTFFSKIINSDADSNSARQPSKRGGFSLGLLFTALVGVALIVAVAAPIYNSLQGEKLSVQKQLNQLSDAISEYFRDTGHLPETLKDLSTKPTSEKYWLGPYVSMFPDKVDRDAWGKTFIYIKDPKLYDNVLLVLKKYFNPNMKRTFLILSCGVDGKVNTENRTDVNKKASHVSECDPDKLKDVWWLAKRITDASNESVAKANIDFEDNDEGVWGTVHPVYNQYYELTVERLKALNRIREDANVGIIEINRMSAEYIALGSQQDYTKVTNKEKRATAIPRAFARKGKKLSQFFQKDLFGRDILWVNSSSGNFDAVPAQAASGIMYSVGFNREDNNSLGDDIRLSDSFMSETVKTGLLDVKLAWGQFEPGTRCDGSGVTEIVDNNSKVGGVSARESYYYSRGYWRSDVLGAKIKPNPDSKAVETRAGTSIFNPSREWISLCVKHGPGEEFVESIYIRGMDKSWYDSVKTWFGNTDGLNMTEFACDDGYSGTHFRGGWHLQGWSAAKLISGDLGLIRAHYLEKSTVKDANKLEDTFHTLCVTKGPDPSETIDVGLFAPKGCDGVSCLAGGLGTALTSLFGGGRDSMSATDKIQCPGSDINRDQDSTGTVQGGIASRPFRAGETYYQFIGEFKHASLGDLAPKGAKAYDPGYVNHGTIISGTCNNARNPMCMVNSDVVDYYSFVSFCTRHIDRYTYVKTLRENSSIPYTGQITDDDDPANPVTHTLAKPNSFEYYQQDVQKWVYLNKLLGAIDGGSVKDLDASWLRSVQFHLKDLHLDWFGLFFRDTIEIANGNNESIWAPDIRTGESDQGVHIFGKFIPIQSWDDSLEVDATPQAFVDIPKANAKPNTNASILPKPHMKVKIQCKGCNLRGNFSLFGLPIGKTINQATALYRGFVIDKVQYTCNSANELDCLSFCVEDSECRAFTGPRNNFEIGAAQYIVTNIDINLNGKDFGDWWPYNEPDLIGSISFDGQAIKDYLHNSHDDYTYSEPDSAGIGGKTFNIRAGSRAVLDYWDDNGKEGPSSSDNRISNDYYDIKDEWRKKEFTIEIKHTVKNNSGQTRLTFKCVKECDLLQ
ncbi:type II secretion system protein GspG [Deltaproteobacteria bacterium TL4]